jgi:hypothetical protein
MGIRGSKSLFGSMFLDVEYSGLTAILLKNQKELVLAHEDQFSAVRLHATCYEAPLEDGQPV